MGVPYSVFFYLNIVTQNMMCCLFLPTAPSAIRFCTFSQCPVIVSRTVLSVFLLYESYELLDSYWYYIFPSTEAEEKTRPFPSVTFLGRLFYFRSEEPALTNMDISTGHMVLVSCNLPSIILSDLDKSEYYSCRFSELHGRSS